MQTQNICVDCQRDISRYSAQRFYEKRRELKAAANKRWKERNREKVREMNRALYKRKRGLAGAWL
jgi:hypothetical protein